jgi:hypothetical protein
MPLSWCRQSNQFVSRLVTGRYEFLRWRAFVSIRKAFRRPSRSLNRFSAQELMIPPALSTRWHWTLKPIRPGTSRKHVTLSKVDVALNPCRSNLQRIAGVLQIAPRLVEPLVLRLKKRESNACFCNAITEKSLPSITPSEPDILGCNFNRLSATHLLPHQYSAIIQRCFALLSCIICILAKDYVLPFPCLPCWCYGDQGIEVLHPCSAHPPEPRPPIST